jgi:multiple antibiotic resistance protein
MGYIEAIIALFAVVDPIGNIPVFLLATENITRQQRQKAFNIAVIVSVLILLIFACAGNAILNYVFQIEIADLQIAGGIILLLIAANNLVFESQRSLSAMRRSKSAVEIGCVPLACPLLAGPGSMVTSLTTWQNPEAGPVAALLAIAVVLGAFWVMMRFIEPVGKVLGTLTTTVVSKVMLLFIAAIGVHMIILGLQHYFFSKTG